MRQVKTREVVVKHKFVSIGTLIGLAALSLAAMAADVTGQWKGSFSVPSGSVINQTLSFSRLADGTLRGSITNEGANAIDLIAVKLEGNKLTFSAKPPDGPDLVDYDGTLDASGDAIQFVMTVHLPGGTDKVSFRATRTGKVAAK